MAAWLTQPYSIIEGWSSLVAQETLKPALSSFFPICTNCGLHARCRRDAKTFGSKMQWISSIGWSSGNSAWALMLEELDKPFKLIEQVQKTPRRLFLKFHACDCFLSQRKNDEFGGFFSGFFSGFLSAINFVVALLHLCRNLSHTFVQNWRFSNFL